MSRTARLALFALFAGACAKEPRTDISPTTQPLVCTSPTNVQTHALTRPPPALSGGTLLILRGGHTAVAADPDRDRVWFVDLDQFRPNGWVSLTGGDEPGRLVED